MKVPNIFTCVVFFFIVVVVFHLKHLRIVLRCAKAGCGKRTSSSWKAPMSWQKRVVAKAGHLSQRCSADSTHSSQSRQRSDSVFLVSCSHRRRLGWCSLRNLTRSVSSALLRALSLIWFVLVVNKSMKRGWLLGSGVYSRWITFFLVFWSKCRSADCCRVDPRLAFESTCSLPQMLQCSETQTMSNFLEQMILAMDR